MKYLKIILPFILLLNIFSIPFAQKSLDNIIHTTYTMYDCPESNAYLDNPYEGFYHIYGYVLGDDVSYASISDVPNLPKTDDESQERLVQLQINLRNYAKRPISDSALRQFDMILSAWSQTNYSVILRPLYDWNGQAASAEPDNIEQILTHMEQLAKVYNNYTDTIYIIQGLSTGNNGEMHHTNYGSKKDMGRLAKKLARVSDPSIYLSVRTPGQWRSVTGVDGYPELSAMPENLYLGRLGLYNDGMFGSISDTGTYVERTREEELAFQDELCRTVPNGGEAIIDNPYNDLNNAIRDMRMMHVSYLNSGHDAAVIAKWQNSTYRGEGVFNGFSGLEYIRNHLGYRYVIRESQFAPRGFRRKPTLLLTIENAGFSASYRRFAFELSLINSETEERFTLTPDYDSSALPGNGTQVLEIPIDGHDYPPATYELYWQTTDCTSGEAIHYGNKLPLTEHGYKIGSLTIEAPYRHTDR